MGASNNVRGRSVRSTHASDVTRLAVSINTLHLKRPAIAPPVAVANPRLQPAGPLIQVDPLEDRRRAGTQGLRGFNLADTDVYRAALDPGRHGNLDGVFA